MRFFEPVTKDMRKDAEAVIMPLRATTGSCAYDIFTPVDISIKPGKTGFVWTNVKAKMLQDEVFVINVRSSAGTKLGVMMANTIGWVDSDYYNNPDNEGNIGICLRNMGKETVEFKAGDRIAQGLFQKYLVASNCNSKETRLGGFGSTGS